MVSGATRSTDVHSYVLVNAGSALSGAERVLVRTAQGMTGRGWRVSCVAPTGGLSRELATLDLEHTDIRPLVRAPGGRVGRVVRQAAAMTVAARTLRRVVGPRDVVLLNSIQTLPAVRLARLPRQRVSYLVHDVTVSANKLRLLRACAPSIGLAIAVSEAAAVAPRDAGIPTVVVRNGTPWPVEPVKEDRTPPFTLGVNGTLTPWKGHDVVLDAIGALPPSIRAQVRVEFIGGTYAGDEDYVAQLEAKAARLGISDIVEFVGAVPDPLTHMRRWSVAISASVDPEAAPLNVLEAMSIGLPVVGTAHGGTAEVLDEAGFLVPPRDAAALADAVTRLLRDRDAWTACSDAGPRLVAERYTAEERERELLDVLEAFAAGALSPAGS